MQRGEVFAGLVCVAPDLVSQSLHGGEFFLPPQAVEKFHAQFFAVQVAAEIEDKAFYSDPAVVVPNGGAHAHVGDGLVVLSVKPHPGSVYAVGRDDDGIGDVQMVSSVKSFLSENISKSKSDVLSNS